MDEAEASRIGAGDVRTRFWTKFPASRTSRTDLEASEASATSAADFGA